MPRSTRRWRVPRIFALYPGLLQLPPTVSADKQHSYIRWTNVDNGPPEVILVLATVGPVAWDYTIRDIELGFMRHHFGPHGDPDKDPWTDVAP